MLIANPRARRGPYPEDLRKILTIAAAEDCRQWLRHWPLIEMRSTPLRLLPDLAARLGLAEVWLKDESVRSPLGSFKALGAPIALARLLRRRMTEQQFDPAALFHGHYRQLFLDTTVISATDGNHGRALAAAAASIGCRCVIVLHAGVSLEREQAIAAHGAEIVRTAGNYDRSVAEAARLATENGWLVVSDTSYEGYEDIPRDVMQGYGVLAAELIEQSGSRPDAPAFTHVLLQGGVGGFAAGVAGSLWEYHGEHRPQLLVVEPRQADCLWQSCAAGRPARAGGSTDSLMAGLACGECSPLAWEVLQDCIDLFLTVEDEDAVAAMQVLAAGSERDMPVVAGESGAAGLAGLAALAADPDARSAARLEGRARVLLINTEGATSPAIYRELVGEPAESVLARQLARTNVTG